MFAARANQENAVYERQTAAASKPLNQGVKGLAPKTPANKDLKAPFKGPLNDENLKYGGEKQGGKGQQGGLFGEGKGGEAEGNAFATPARTTTRAPLGRKTTNAKATAFQTPAADTYKKPVSAKPTSPRLRRAKIKVHEAEPDDAEEPVEEREIEHMPPREVPLPDYPDDWPHERTYPQFEGNNLTKGWADMFAKKWEEDDDTEFSDFEEQMKEVEKRENKEKERSRAQAVKKKPAAGLQKTTRDPLTSNAPPQTLKSRSAASALSSDPTRRMASFAAPTAASKAAQISISASKQRVGKYEAPINFRHAAAKAASNSTLGYSKGRAVSAGTRKPSTDSQVNRVHFGNAGENALSKTSGNLDGLFGGLDLHVSDEDVAQISVSMNLAAEEEEEEEVFQLQPVED